MAEYYGFKDAGEVKANPTLDWATVANTVAADLDKIKVDRQKLRAEDQKLTTDNLDLLSKADLGADQSINKELTNAIFENKKLQGEWYKQLTSGNMTRQDYASKTQAMKNNWGVLNNVVKNRAANDKVLVDAIQSNSQDALTSLIANKVGSLQNLKDKKLYTDPKTGAMVVADYDENGKIIESSIMDINSINNAQVNAAPRVNLPDEVNKFSGAKVAKFITDNGITSLEDATRTGSYNEIKKATQDFVLSNDRRIADVLVNSTGKGYFLTTDQKESDSNPLAVLVKGTGGNFEVILDPEKDSKKIEDAKFIVGKALDNQMPFEQEVTLPTPRQPRAAAAGDKPEPMPTISQVNPIRIGNKQGAVAIINDPVGIKTNSGFVEKVVNAGIDEDGRHFVKVVRYNSKENVGAAGGSTSFSASQTTPKTYVYYGEQITPRLKGDKKDIREYSPTNYANFRDRAGFGSDEELRGYLEGSRGIALPVYKAPAASSSAPKVGTVADGYKFLGGDPANSKNWKKI
jgi:hypothetical protein